MTKRPERVHAHIWDNRVDEYTPVWAVDAEHTGTFLGYHQYSVTLDDGRTMELQVWFDETN